MAKSCELVSQITTSPRISFQKTPYIYYTLGRYIFDSFFFKREHELHGVSRRQRFVLKQIYKSKINVHQPKRNTT